MQCNTTLYTPVPHSVDRQDIFNAIQHYTHLSHLVLTDKIFDFNAIQPYTPVAPNVDRQDIYTCRTYCWQTRYLFLNAMQHNTHLSHLALTDKIHDFKCNSTLYTPVAQSEWMNEHFYMAHKNSTQNNACSQRQVLTDALANWEQRGKTAQKLNPQKVSRKTKMKT